jgi:hypothetical protein
MKPGSLQRGGETACPSRAPAVRQRRSVAAGGGKQGGRSRGRGVKRGMGGSGAGWRGRRDDRR